MVKSISSIGIMLVYICMYVGYSFAGVPMEYTKKTAIVLVSFGTTFSEAERNTTSVLSHIAKKYAPVPVVLAYTSRTARESMRKKGIDARSLEEQLANLAGDGYTHVVVQSLHVLPGQEFQDVQQIAFAMQGLPKGIQRIQIGEPLLGNDTLVATVARLLYAGTKTLAKEKESAILFLSHGAKEGTIGTLAIPALQYYLWAQKGKKQFVGVLEGKPSAEMVAKELQRNGIKKVYAVPLLTVVGDHYANDIADPASHWNTVLRAHGISTNVVTTPITTIPGIIELWCASIQRSLQSI